MTHHQKNKTYIFHKDNSNKARDLILILSSKIPYFISITFIKKFDFKRVIYIIIFKKNTLKFSENKK